MANGQKTFALILGIVLLIVGIWGLFVGEGNLWNLFGVSIAQSVLHIIAGAFGLYVGLKGDGPGYNATIGWIGVVLGILGFIPGVDTLLSDLLNIDTAITWLHLVIGVVALLVYYTVKR